VLGDLEFAFNIVTILISVAAVVYWVKLFKRTTVPSQRDSGWMWFLASVLVVLLLNLATQLLVITSDQLFSVDQYMLDLVVRFIMAVSRTIMAVTLTAGAYMLYDSMRSRGDMKFAFTPVKAAAEPKSQTKQKYDLPPGAGYILYKGVICDVNGAAGANVPCMDLFIDLVTHDTLGFIVTREYPPSLREKYNLKLTPIIWLTQDKEFPSSVNPSDLTEISHVMKDFISHNGNTVILFDGLEYLLMHNSFEDIIKLIQGLDDVVVQNNCRLIVAVDPKILTEQQIHQLKSELHEFEATVD